MPYLLVPRKMSLIAINMAMTLAMFASAIAAANPSGSMQDLGILNQKVKDFLTIQSAGSPGKAEITTTPIDPRLQLANCAAIETFFPAGSRAWGKTSVGLRCSDPARWTIYVQANISVIGDYLVSAAPLAQGQTITKNDVMFQKGDLTTLPPGIYTNIVQVVGRTASMSLNGGSILKHELLKLPIVVQQGQTVRIVSTGEGFSISAEGRAQGNATEGQVVQARVASGQIVSGVANASGQIEVKFR